MSSLASDNVYQQDLEKISNSHQKLSEIENKLKNYFGGSTQFAGEQHKPSSMLPTLSDNLRKPAAARQAESTGFNVFKEELESARFAKDNTKAHNYTFQDSSCNNIAVDQSINLPQENIMFTDRIKAIESKIAKYKNENMRGNTVIEMRSDFDAKSNSSHSDVNSRLPRRQDTSFTNPAIQERIVNLNQQRNEAIGLNGPSLNESDYDGHIFSSAHNEQNSIFYQTSDFNDKELLARERLRHSEEKRQLLDTINAQEQIISTLRSQVETVKLKNQELVNILTDTARSIEERDYRSQRGMQMPYNLQNSNHYVDRLGNPGSNQMMNNFLKKKQEWNFMKQDNGMSTSFNFEHTNNDTNSSQNIPATMRMRSFPVNNAFGGIDESRSKSTMNSPPRLYVGDDHESLDQFKTNRLMRSRETTKTKSLGRKDNIQRIIQGMAELIQQVTPKQRSASKKGSRPGSNKKSKRPSQIPSKKNKLKKRPRTDGFKSINKNGVFG